MLNVCVQECRRYAELRCSLLMVNAKLKPNWL